MTEVTTVMTIARAMRVTLVVALEDVYRMLTIVTGEKPSRNARVHLTPLAAASASKRTERSVCTGKVATQMWRHTSFTERGSLALHCA